MSEDPRRPYDDEEVYVPGFDAVAVVVNRYVGENRIKVDVLDNNAGVSCVTLDSIICSSEHARMRWRQRGLPGDAEKPRLLDVLTDLIWIERPLPIADKAGYHKDFEAAAMIRGNTVATVYEYRSDMRPVLKEAIDDAVKE